MDNLILLPIPRQITKLPGTLTLKNNLFISMDSPNPQLLFFSAKKIQDALIHLGIIWNITASKGISEEQVGITLRRTSQTSYKQQSYQLEISHQGILIESQDEAGIFYGVSTLLQIINNSENMTLPCLKMIDWPDFPTRGVMLDISRDKVYTMETLLRLIDLLASWKINQLQLYTEHTFAYHRHPEIWAKASPLTSEELLILDRYCKERFIDLVPNQNSFGHMHRWLRFPRYYHLGELAGIEDKNWWGRGSFSLCPGDPGSLELIKSLYEELLPHFSSKMFNVGCDETFDLGLGRSKETCEKHGKGRIYLDFLLKIYDLVKEKNRTMQFWGDIIIQYPDLVPELPKDVIALEWGYEAQNPPAEHCEKFGLAGIPYYVCPGTSSWNSIAGRTDNAIGNLRTAAQNGLKYGACGYLNTDWGDNGHWQVPPVSYLGFAVGAAFSWGYQENQTLDIPTALSVHAFKDPTLSLGKLVFDLGNIYQAVGMIPGNASALFHIMQLPFSEIQKYRTQINPAVLNQTLDAIDQASILLSKSTPNTPDGSLVLKEYDHTIRLLKHACKRGSLALGSKGLDPADLDIELREIMIDYQSIWLQRNRIGGLVDSLARFEKSRLDYQKY
jgi:hexosaminidase